MGAPEAAPPENGLRPRLVIRVGVIGHRPKRGRKLDEAAIGAQASNLINGLGSAMRALAAHHATSFCAEPPLIRLASGLAEGADQIVLAAAPPAYVACERAAILPFPPQTCHALMRSAGAERRFAELLAQCATVMAMTDGPAPEEIDALSEDERRDAYIAQAQGLMEHSDLLIAIWDGKPARGPGGTETSIRQAMDLGLPVLVIAPDGAFRGEVSALPSRGAPRDAGAAFNPAPDLAALAARIAAPPAPTVVAASHDNAATHGNGHASEEDASKRLGAFLAERAGLSPDGSALPRFALHRFLRKMLGGEPRAAFRGLRIAPRPFVPEAGVWDAAAEGLGDKARLDAILARRWQWADALAIRYAELNRSSVIAVPLIGFLAVAMGLVGFILSSGGGGAGYAMKASLLALEIALLLFAYERHFKQPRREHWHRKQVEYRSLAELMRHERFLHLAGFGGRLSRAGAQAGLPDEWIGWYLRATIRELGLPHATLGPAHYARLILRADEIEIRHQQAGQIAYNAARSAECRLIERRLHGFASGLFWWLILPVGIFGVVYIGCLAATKAGLAPPAVAALAKAFPPVTSNLITACMALAPATIAALHSVRAQIDFEEQARRTGDTEQKLRAISKVFAGEAASGAVSRERARRLMGDLTETLSADLSGWSTVYRHKGPEQPG